MSSTEKGKCKIKNTLTSKTPGDELTGNFHPLSRIIHQLPLNRIIHQLPMADSFLAVTAKKESKFWPLTFALTKIRTKIRENSAQIANRVRNLRSRWAMRS